MKPSIEHFTPMGSEQLMETNGGGFAYDVGRVLRFLSFCPFTGVGATMAICDWQINKMINEPEN